MKKYFIPAALVLITAASFTACSDSDDATTDPTAGQVKVVTTITSSASKADLSRAGEDVTKPYAPAGGSLTLFAEKMGSSVSSAFTYADNKWTSAAPLFWDNLKANADGIYSFFAAAPAVPVEAPAVASDQSALKDYTQSDQLVAYTPDQKRLAEVSLNFHHVLSQLTIELKAGVGADNPDYLDPEKATIKLSGVATNYTLSYTHATISQPAVATAGSADAAALLTPQKANGRHFLVVPPQALNAKALTVSLTIDGKSYSWTNPDAFTLASGTSQKIELSIKKSSLTLASSGIVVTEWDDTPATISGEATIDGVTVSDGALNDIKEAGTFYLYTNTNLSAPSFSEQVFAQGIYPVAYDKDATPAASFDKTNAAYKPLAWDDMPKYQPAPNTDKLAQYEYTALYVPADPTDPTAVKNQEKDYLIGTSAATSWGTSPDFSTAADNQMKHYMAKVTVTLTSKTGAYTADQLKAASTTLTLKRTLKFFLSLPAADSKLPPRLGTAEVTDPNETNVTLLNTSGSQASESATFSALMCQGQPYDKDDEMFTLVIDNKTYTLKAPQDIVLKSGQNLKITLDVNKAVIIPSSIKVSDWEEGKEVVIGEGTIDGITESGMLTVFDKGTKKDGTYPIAYANGKASFGTGGTSLEWGINTGSKVPLKALFEPTASAVGNQEKDFLYTEKSVLWGIPLSLELDHIMGRIRVSLTSSDGTYKDEDLKGATLTTERSYKCKIAAECTVDNESVGVGENTVTFTNNKDKTFLATLYPQTISKLQLTIAGKLYTLEKEIKLESGKIYQLKADIGHNITVSDVTVVDWTEVDGGDGTFTK